jgi:hypothetical protein
LRTRRVGIDDEDLRELLRTEIERWLGEREE